MTRFEIASNRGSPIFESSDPFIHPKSIRHPHPTSITSRFEVVVQSKIVMSVDCMRRNKDLLILLVIMLWRESSALIRCHGKRLGRHHLLSTSSSIFHSPSLRLFASTTQYTIEEEGVDPEVLEKTVYKHFANLHRFLEAKPVAAHTEEAFATLASMLGSMGDAPIILDSGCGTGKSTVILGQLYPDHTIVGVDRSLARLTKNGIYRAQDDATIGDTCTNVVFVRADLVDFWRLWTQSSLLPKPVQHYLLYPNPYPKKRRFQNRWYAHPTLPLVLRDLDSDKIVVRSNWKAYLEDFASATTIANQLQLETGDSSNSYVCHPPTIVDPTQAALTNFEQKYFDCGEECYELVLTKTAATAS